jgi:Zn-dependent peptidase ImmA (M78 family)
MTSDYERAAARIMDWGDLRRVADADIIQILQSSPECMSATNRRNQYYDAYVLLRLEHRLGVSISMIGRRFRVGKATIQWHYKAYVAQATRPHANGQPPILTQDEYNHLIERIRRAYGSNNLWTM